MHKVLIVQKSLTQYRIEFFNLLRQELSKKNIELQLVYGDSHVDSRKDSATCEWATFKMNKTINLGGIKAIWQPCLQEIKSADLVIVEQANKLLINYLLMLRKAVANKKFAFWGHGRDLQATSRSPLSIFKTFSLKMPTWWFAYTNGVKNYLISKGVDSHKITAVQNAIDTKQLNEQYQSVTSEETAQLKTKYGIGDEPVLIYCGALSKEKNIDFLIDAASQLHQRNYRFTLLIVGSGPYQSFVEDAAKQHSWLRYAGPQFGREKAKIFKIADLFLLPGAIGLAVLDSFAFETPLITISIPNHGPEFEYLIHDYNGVVAKPQLDDYVLKIIDLLDHPEKTAKLKRACRPMLEEYNIEKMVAHFVSGVEQVLAKG